MNDEQAELKVHLKEVVALLNKINRTVGSDRLKIIGELQNILWDEPVLQSDALYFLQDLAGDLNFYEPTESDRDETLGYYDDVRLLELMDAAIKEIEPLIAAQ